MSDVSCKVIQSHMNFLEKQGSSPKEFLEGLTTEFPTDDFLKPGFIGHPRNRIPWNSYVSFSEFLEKWNGHTEWEEAFLADSIRGQQTWIPYVHSAMGLISSPLQLYRLSNLLIGPGTFGDAVQPSLEVLPDGRIKIRLALAPGAKHNPQFFRISRFGIQKAPNLLGLPDSRVEVEFGDREATYFVSPPPSNTLWARFLRAFRMFFFAGKVLEEITQENRQFRLNYENLIRSEAELKVARRELEIRVEERTKALKESNRQLQEQLANVIAKEEENRQLYERLIHLQKLEAVGTLAGGISHEINNVLHGIYLSADLAYRKIEVGHPAKEKIETVKRFASRGGDIMKQVLAFSRKVDFEKAPLNIASAVEEAVKLMRTTLPKSISIEENYDLDALDGWAVTGDLTQIQQVVINLLSNSSQAMKERGGLINVSVKRASPNNGEAVIAIRDNGEGIPNEIKDRIFEPFFTTKPVGEGTGMGLSVVHGIVQGHGGRIDFESLSGKGTEFRVTLPLVSARHDEVIELTEDDLSGGSEHILIVDDETDLLPLLSDTLNAFGYKVTTATTPRKAEQVFAESPDTIDLVLLDYSMPEMNGADLAKRLRGIRPALPILLCSGFTDLKELRQFEGQVVDACLSKPLDGLLLNGAIRAALTAKSPSSSEVG